MDTKRRGRLTLAQRLEPIERAIATHRKKLTEAIDRRDRIIAAARADAENALAQVGVVEHGGRTAFKEVKHGNE